jgi:riboflavin synthase
MFTGIIEGVGTIAQLTKSGAGISMAVAAELDLDQTGIGDSIAVNGACLTAVKIENQRFHVDVSPETLSTTTLSSAQLGQRVNLERALRLSDRLDGHLVSGHIDGIGVVARYRSEGNAIVIAIKVPEQLVRYMIVKGSVAVDGVSLTINRLQKNLFEASVIPHTASETTVGDYKPGSSVNIETDLVGKYIERFVQTPSHDSPDASHGRRGIDRELLAKSGFL